MFITDLERRAARQLGVEKPWLYDPRPLTDCPLCAEKIKPGVAVCRSCGAILDREKAAQYGIVVGNAKHSPRRQRTQAEKPEEDPAGKWALAPTAQPVNASLVRASRVEDPESYDGIDGLLSVAENNGQAIHSAFKLRERLYFVKEHSLFATQDDGTNEPSR
jgi:hypothetical protein